MSVRRLLVEVDVAGLNVSEFCRQHGVSTWFFYDLRRRYAAEGPAALEPRSRAPRRVWNKTSPEVENLVVLQRKQLEDHGLDFGPEEVAAALVGMVDCPPSPATVYRVLKGRGLITAEPRKAPTSSRRFNAARANESWQLDDMGWELADGTEIKILNIVDDHSRLLVASTAMANCTGAAAFAVVAETAATLGWPERFQSDNANTYRGVLADALRPLGVAAAHSRPNHPQTNGKVERFHQTAQKWLRAHEPVESLTELQARLDLYRHHYNHHRRHRGIGRRIPAQVWAAAPKAGPADRPLRPPTTIHHSRVIGGRITLNRYLVSVGAAHDGQLTLTLTTGLDCHVFINGRLIRQLTIDPARRSQPLYDRPGRPTVRNDPRHP